MRRRWRRRSLPYRASWSMDCLSAWRPPRCSRAPAEFGRLSGPEPHVRRNGMTTFTKTLLMAGFGLVLSALSAQAQAPKPADVKPPPASAIAAATELLQIKKANTVYQNIVPSVIQRTKDAI